MKILVTGVAGFLGSALAQQFLDDGHEVLGLDDLSTGKEEAIPEGVKFELGDMLDRPKLWTLLQGVECVYHLASKNFPLSSTFLRTVQIEVMAG